MYGLVEEIMAVTPALLAALTGSLPAEASVVRLRTILLRAKGGNPRSIGDLKSKTQSGYFWAKKRR